MNRTHHLIRRQFLTSCGILGLGLPLQWLFSTHIANAAPVDPGRVIIIGAGAAGMSAGYLLAQAGVDFQIIEAAPSYGGRMKRTHSFTDFPVPLGAEWLHADHSTLHTIVNDPTVRVQTQTQGYSSRTRYGYFAEGELYLETLDEEIIDRKFIGSTWFDFFADYIAPGLYERMAFNTQIVAIDYSGQNIQLLDQYGQQHIADKVIITVPLKVLQRGDIHFTPDLPPRHAAAIADAEVWGGIKVFMAFTEAFYPTFLGFPDSETDTGQRLYYDAAYGQHTQANILGLFAVGKQAEPYQAHADGGLRDYILDELSQIYGDIPAQRYLKHIAQNWNQEPFIHGAYLADVAPSYLSRTLSQPIANKLFFAGEAYTQADDWGSVHHAAASARDAVQSLLA